MLNIYLHAKRLLLCWYQLLTLAVFRFCRLFVNTSSRALDVQTVFATPLVAFSLLNLEEDEGLVAVTRVEQIRALLLLWSQCRRSFRSRYEIVRATL
jgi:hypothetical protein